MRAKAVIREPGEGKKVTLAGEPMTFLVTGEDTRYTSMFDCTLPPGFSTGLHVHSLQEETFYVLEGECEWQVGSQLIRARPGTFVFIPPGVPHNIANASDKPARMLLTVSPPGFEHYFEAVAILILAAVRTPCHLGIARPQARGLGADGALANPASEGPRCVDL